MVVKTLRKWKSFGKHDQVITVSVVKIYALPERGTLGGSIGFWDCFGVKGDRRSGRKAVHRWPVGWRWDTIIDHFILAAFFYLPMVRNAAKSPARRTGQRCTAASPLLRAWCLATSFAPENALGTCMRWPVSSTPTVGVVIYQVKLPNDFIAIFSKPLFTSDNRSDAIFTPIKYLVGSVRIGMTPAVIHSASVI